MAVASVKFRCRLQGLASPVGPATDRVLAGLRREGKGRGRGQVDGVRFSEVDTAAAGSGRLVVGASKTDQEGRGAVLYLGAPTVTRVNAWLAAAGHQDGPLFRRARRGGRVEGDPGRRLSVNAIRRIIRSRRGLDRRDADGAPVAVAGDAGPLCTGPVGCTGQLPAARGAVARVRYGRG